MKKVLFAMMAAALFMACNEGNGSAAPSAKAKTDSPKTESIADDAKQTGSAAEKAMEKPVDSPKTVTIKIDSPKVK